MYLHFTVWIFIYGTLLRSPYASSSESVTPSDSSISNLVVESSTNVNSEKLLKLTTHQNSSDSFSLNNVNTESLHSNLASEECRNGDCAKDVYTSSNNDNSSSSASKILWNLVSTAKSTTESPVSDEMNSEEITVPLYFPVNAYSSNSSVVNDTNFYSNDNELDSEIDTDNNLLNFLHGQTDKFNSNLYSINNFTATSAEPAIMTTEILLNELVNSEDNSSVASISTEKYPRTDFYSHNNISDGLNTTEVANVAKDEESTGYTDDELDFTTYFSDMSTKSSDSHDTNILDKNVISKLVVPENSTTEMPYYDSEALPENDNSSTLLSTNNGESFGSYELKSKSTAEMDAESSELLPTSHDGNTVPAFQNSDNTTSVFPDYETSAEIEELKYKISRMVDIVDMRNDTSIPQTLFDFSTTIRNDESESTTVPISPDEIDFNATEMPTTHLEMKSTQNSSEKYGVSAEDNQFNNDLTTENTASYHFISSINIPWDEMTNNDSLESTELTTSHERINSILDLTLKDSTTKNPTAMANDFSSLLGSDENSTFNIDTDSIETADLSSDNLNVTDLHHIVPTTSVANFDSSTEKNQTYSSEILVSDDTSTKGTSVIDSSTESVSADISSMKSYDISTDVNLNVIDLNETKISSIPAANSNSVYDIDRTTSVETSYESTAVDSKSAVTSSKPSSTMDITTVDTLLKEGSQTENTNNANQVSDTSIEITSKISYEIYDTTTAESSTTSENPDIESNILMHTSRVSTASTENYAESKFTQTEHSTEVTNATENVPAIHSHKADSEVTGIFKSSATESPLLSDAFTTESTVSRHSETVRPIITEKDFRDNIHYTSDKTTTTTKQPVTDIGESTSATDLKHFDSIPVSSFQERESTSSTTTTTPSEELSSTVAETHREGKHIPFSSTLVRRTTAHPTVFNVTVKTPPQSDTTDHDLVNLRYNQIKAEELSPEERTNLINAVVKFSDRPYSKDELIERMAVIHLWLLHAVADEYKNATLNLPITNATKSDEIEFENLPQILYVLPSPEAFLPNVSFTFVVHNKWRNETFPADIILTILNLHAENLKKILVDIEEIHFSQGLLVQKHDLMAVIIEKYGIILLSTCLITVGMIFLLICVVIYYRKKTRHSAHCLTDDKLHRNMQEAMGIDLNPAVIILQEEIREKAALNGNKVCSLDGDEGWLAPINDVPVEDNNAPFVQDTKL